LNKPEFQVKPKLRLGLKFYTQAFRKLDSN